MGVSGSTLSGRPLRMQAQRVDPSDTPASHQIATTQGPLRDVFGEYTIIKEKFNQTSSTKRDWYCKHKYDREGGLDGYHYVHLDGRYFSQNPDGSKETINPILKEAFYTPPGSNHRIECSDEVDWEELNEIPDLCIARASVTHEAVAKFIQEMKSRADRTIQIDRTKNRKICARMLKGKETADMETDDEAEETETETEEVSDEEGATKKQKENQQRNDCEEDHTPQETMAQRETPTPEDQMLRAVTPISDLKSIYESTDESTDLGETEGTSSQKRKAIEMDDGEDETMRTPAAKRANTHRRREPELTAAQRQEQKRIANRRKRERAKTRKASAR
ncbi:hypothetical protein N7453_011149 [Penicillium expansum]|nr:hypothetical protein N7453_011149 [Penicillium expansum]